MAKVYSLEGIVPVIDPSAFVHAEAVLIGDVIVGPRCYIGPCACLRGDFGRIRLEAGVNVQDTCVIHSFPEVDVIIEEDGHIGHGSVIHGCIVKKNALVGMNSVVMDNAVIGENSLVAACSFVKARHENSSLQTGCGYSRQCDTGFDRGRDCMEIDVHQTLSAACSSLHDNDETRGTSPIRGVKPGPGFSIASRAGVFGHQEIGEIKHACRQENSTCKFF